MYAATSKLGETPAASSESVRRESEQQRDWPPLESFEPDGEPLAERNCRRRPRGVEIRGSCRSKAAVERSGSTGPRQRSAGRAREVGVFDATLDMRTSRPSDRPGVRYRLPSGPCLEGASATELESPAARRPRDQEKRGGHCRMEAQDLARH